MKAAIYARKSTEDDRGEDDKSVTRQIKRAKQYAVAKGWTVADENVYLDDGLSGAEFRRREGFLRLINAATRHDFDAIVMSEPSRLGRDMVRNACYISEILGSNVRLFYYLTDEEERADTPESKLLMSVKGYAAEDHKLRSSQRSRDALERKTRQGFNAGGRVYGYDNHQVWTTNAKDEPTRSHTEYRINEHEAEVIRGIFQMCADGFGVGSIAKTLNGEPRYAAQAQQHFSGERPASPRGKGSWAPATLHSMLRNERYVGTIPFGEHRKVFRKGTKVRLRQQQFERIAAPHLRIVPEDLWQAVRKRSESSQKSYLAKTGGQRWGRSGPERDSKYLLTGFARCKCCGANIVALARPSGSGQTRRQVHYYGCSWRNSRGSTVCENSHLPHMDAVDSSVLDAIQSQVLNPEHIGYVIEQAYHLALEQRRENPNRKREIEAEIERLSGELRRFLDLIASGEAPTAVLEEIRGRETRLEGLRSFLGDLTATPNELDSARLKRAIRERAARMTDTLRADVAGARAALRELLDGPLTFSPVVSEGRKTYAFEGKTKAGALVSPIYMEVASPRGFEPRLPP